MLIEGLHHNHRWFSGSFDGRKNFEDLHEAFLQNARSSLVNVFLHVISERARLMPLEAS